MISDSDNYEDTDDELVAAHAAASHTQQQPKQLHKKRTSSLSEKNKKPKKTEVLSVENQYRHLFTKEEFEAHLLKCEKDREMEICERIEAEDEQKTRDKIQKELDNKEMTKEQKAAKGDSNKNLDDSSSDEEFQRGVQRKKAATERGTQNKAALSIHDVFGAASTSSESSSSDDSSDERSSRSSRGSSPGIIDDSDDEEPAKLVEGRQDLQKARITRSQLAKIVHAPFFGDVVRGSFVQIRTGPIKESDNDSIISQVLSVEQTGKVYDLEGTRTNKGVKIKYGSHERIYRLNFVSNADWREEVYKEWVTVVTEQKGLPTMDHVEKKQKEIHEALHHRYSDKEIDLMVKEKQRFYKDKVRNVGAHKAELLIKLKYAEDQRDRTAIARIQKEIDEFDKKVEVSGPQNISEVRKKVWMEELILSKRHLKEQNGDLGIGSNSRYEHEGDDPFTRKREHTRVVCGSGKSLSGTRIDEASKRKANEGSMERMDSERNKKGFTTPNSATNKTFEMYKSLGKIDIDFDGLGAPYAKKGCFSPSTKRAMSPVPKEAGRNILSEDSSSDEGGMPEIKTEYENPNSAFSKPIASDFDDIF